ncbi:MAG: hypothetical protein QM589_19255 [Thermomicrobiales bacterium]
MRDEEFIFIDGQAVRLTSIARDGDRLSLVVVVRGSGSHDELRSIMDRDTFEVTLGDEPPRRMRVGNLDLRSTGTGATGIHRFAIALEPVSEVDPEPAPVPEPDIAQRLARIERKLDAIIARLDADGRISF